MLADPPRDTVVLRILFTEDRWLSFLLAPDAHDLHRWAWTAGWAYRRERVTASATIRRRRWSSTGLTREPEAPLSPASPMSTGSSAAGTMINRGTGSPAPASPQ